MRVYIASKYIDHKDINRKIYAALSQAGIDAFLPEVINIDAVSGDEMRTVMDICNEEIARCDVLLAVCPYGNSVSAEISRAICLRELLHKKIKIVTLYPDKPEAMITPAVDKSVDTIEQLLDYLKSMPIEQA